jgi:hypothetical protein
MTDHPEGRPRPTPRPRPGSSARPSPRPRVAGSRREREEAEAAEPRAPRAAATLRATARPTVKPVAGGAGAARAAAARSGRASAGAVTEAGRRRPRALALTLAVLCVLALSAAGFLLWERLNPRYVDSSILAAARSGVQALYAYDYRDSEGSVERKLEVLTGDLREQYETDLSQGGILDTYEQVSATTSYEVLDVGLQQVNDAQDTATLVVFGQYVVKSVNSGDQPAPEGSECQVTPEGAQSCTQTVQVRLIEQDGDWKISELTLLTSS